MADEVSQASFELRGSSKRDWLAAGVAVAAFVAVSGFFNAAVDSAPLVDEPIYASSAFEWAATGHLNVSGLSAPLAVFDTLWGGLFVRLFGESYQALRWSTIALTALSAPFLYWLLSHLTDSRALRVLGLGVFLFSPLTVVLSASFMSDMHTAALTVIASALFVRGLRDGIQSKWLALGSVVCAIGFLSRPHILVLPVAALIVVAIDFRPLRTRAFAAAAVVSPALVGLGAYGALASLQDDPFMRTLSNQILLDRIPGDVPVFLALAAISTVFYVGLIALPLTPLVWKGRPKEVSTAVRVTTWMVLALGLAALLTQRDPILKQAWISSTGFAGVDRSQLGQRPEIWPTLFQMLLGLAAIGGTAILLRSVWTSWPERLDRVKQFLVLSLLGSVAGAMLASMAPHRAILDRYWAPMIPLVVALAVGVAKMSRTVLIISTALAVVVGLFAVLGTYDGLIAQREIVQFANEAVEAGVDQQEFDGGASWSALTFGVADSDGAFYVLNRVGPYWVRFYAVETEPSFGVTLEALDGYEVLDRREIPSILHLAPVYVYLVEREEEPYFFRVDDF